MYATKIANALRPLAPSGKLKDTPGADEVALINQLAKLWELRHHGIGEPAWIKVGKQLIGLKEVVGSKHNPIIVSWWMDKVRRATWYRDDETPWCGAFVKHCMEQAGLTYPTSFPSAASWGDYGISVSAQVGAIGVKKRKGGNHVFFIIGETADGAFFKVLEGNANNMVRIGDIPKSQVYSIRWPAAVEQLRIPLPIMSKGVIAGSEA